MTPTTPARPWTSWIPTAIFGVAAVLMLAAGTAGSAQLLAAAPPCDYLCLAGPFAAFLFAGTFLVAAGLAEVAALATSASRLWAGILGCLAVAIAATALVLLADARYPVPAWTIAGPVVAALGVVALVPIRPLAVLLAGPGCVGLLALAAVALAPPTPPAGAPPPSGGSPSYPGRRDPAPADAAALRPAARDLTAALQDLRARDLSDEASTRQALMAYPTLDGARVHPPTSERLFDRDTTVVVVLWHGSACLIGELGPADDVVHVVGLTPDGGCEALLGH
jgi:hypothetical protein